MTLFVGLNWVGFDLFIVNNVVEILWEVLPM